MGGWGELPGMILGFRIWLQDLWTSGYRNPKSQVTSDCGFPFWDLVAYILDLGLRSCGLGSVFLFVDLNSGFGSSDVGLGLLGICFLGLIFWALDFGLLCEIHNPRSIPEIDSIAENRCYSLHSQSRWWNKKKLRNTLQNHSHWCIHILLLGPGGTSRRIGELGTAEQRTTRCE